MELVGVNILRSKTMMCLGTVLFDITAPLNNSLQPTFASEPFINKLKRLLLVRQDLIMQGRKTMLLSDFVFFQSLESQLEA